MTDTNMFIVSSFRVQLAIIHISVVAEVRFFTIMLLLLTHVR